MQRGALSVEGLSGGIDLGLTIESGQTYLWRREDGRTYEGGATPLEAETGDAPWYVTVVGVDENDEPMMGQTGYHTGDGNGDFVQMILEQLKTAGVQQAHKEDKINFTSVTPWPGDYVCAEGRFEGEMNSGQWIVNSSTNHKPLFPSH